MNSKKISLGFSLIEMAFVLVIVTLLLGGLLVPFSTQIEQKRIADTQKAMAEINEALLGYAIANGQLPCAASATSGGNQQTSPTCLYSGFLPAANLGVNGTDAWGRQYRYAVSPNFTLPFSLPASSCPGSNPCGVITVQTRNSTGSIAVVANYIVAIVISQGKNGYGGYSSAGVPMALPNANTDEYTNSTSATAFFTRTQVGPRSPCSDSSNPVGLCEFDDIVTWVSPNVLFNRMVAAGKLP